jgi:hypothetical protein
VTTVRAVRRIDQGEVVNQYEQYKNNRIGERGVNLSGPTVGEYMTRMSAEEAWIFQGLGGALPAKVVRRLKVKAHMELLGRRECST